MPKHPPHNIEKMIAEGRGQGRGKDYKPFLDTYNTRSRGRTCRSQSIKSSRKAYLLSELETQCFDIYDFSGEVVDVREQYPLLPLDETVTIP